MRVLVLEDEKINSYATMEINDIGYDDDITGIKDENGHYNRYEDAPVSGIYMIDTDGDYLYIEGVTLYDCNKVCEEIVKTGYADLRKYGTYYYED